MSKELESCPFCGRKPVIEHLSSGEIMYMIKCGNPNCPVPVVSYPAGHDFDEVLA